MDLKTRSPLVLSVAAFAVVAGCSIDPKNYETAPVEVATTQGTVTCQLYTPERTIWDRAIDWPRSMTAAEADATCKLEGDRRKG